MDDFACQLARHADEQSSLVQQRLESVASTAREELQAEGHRLATQLQAAIGSEAAARAADVEELRGLLSSLQQQLVDGVTGAADRACDAHSLAHSAAEQVSNSNMSYIAATFPAAAAGP